MAPSCVLPSPAPAAPVLALSLTTVLLLVEAIQATSTPSSLAATTWGSVFGTALGVSWEELDCLPFHHADVLHPAGMNRAVGSDSQGDDSVFGEAGGASKVAYSLWALFGSANGPADLSCNNPLFSAAALGYCGVLAQNAAQKQEDSASRFEAVNGSVVRFSRLLAELIPDASGVLGASYFHELCLEEQEVQRERLFHCMGLKQSNAAEGPGPAPFTFPTFASKSHRTKHAMRCIASATCSEPKLDQLCSSYLLPLFKRVHFCTTEFSLLHKKCRRQWPGFGVPLDGSMVDLSRLLQKIDAKISASPPRVRNELRGRLAEAIRRHDEVEHGRVNATNAGGGRMGPR